MGRWRDQIELLSKVDLRLSSFGAPSHRFRSRPVPLHEVIAFEELCEICLPEDYRDYLLEVGFGVGPYHGLLTFTRIVEELQFIYETYELPNRSPRCAGEAFGLEDEITEALEAGRPLEFRAPTTPGGFIPFCEQGCEFLAVLVTAGKFRGRVFDTTDFAQSGSRWSAAKSPPGVITSPGGSAPDASMPSLPAFTDWCEAWIRCSRRDLGVV